MSKLQMALDVLVEVILGTLSVAVCMFAPWAIAYFVVWWLGAPLTLYSAAHAIGAMWAVACAWYLLIIRLGG